MKLYYSPSYTGFVYTNLSDLMFNEKIVDTAGLVDVIRLHAGLESEKKENIERSVNYYKAMKSYMKKNPSNVMKASFEVDGLSVAKKCLSWRDTLTYAGWNRTVKAPDERMEVLCGIEEFFNDRSAGEELVAVTEAVKAGCALPENLEIQTPFDYRLFSPLEVRLIDALALRGVRITVQKIPDHKNNALSAIINTLESSEENKVRIKKDDSFKILHFEEQDEACRYLSLLAPDSHEVWINSDNKVLDNWLYLEGKPVSGSEIKAGLPQITQILSIGLGTLASPMDLKNMIEWLNVSVSPLSSSLRKALEEKIAREGGYYNKECQEVIDNFINCTDEFKELPEEERAEKIKAESEKRADIIRRFLPDIQKPENAEDGTVGVNRVKSFTENLYAWCGTELALLKDNIQKSQIGMVRNECSAVLSMLESEAGDRMSFSKLMSFVTNLKDGVDMPQYEAQCGCKTVVAEPGRINSPVKSLIWCDFYDEPAERLTWNFLLPAERDAFSETLMLWDEETEREYNRKIKMLPFMLAEKVTLVVIDKKVTEDVEKHPVMIQLEKKVENLEDFIVRPDVYAENKGLLKDAAVINNGMDPAAEGISIKKAALIKWPEKEYYSSLDQLVYNPFDYVFSTLAKIKSLGSSSLPRLNSTYGTAAHAVIETLFNRYEGVEGSGTPEFIRENINNNFDSVFADMVNGHGAILLLKENILNIENYKAQVLKCVNALLKVIEDNKLHVLACEPKLENKNMGFAENIKIGGYADMILADDENNPVVFDFKWYPGKQDEFAEIIRENKSIQLELYKKLTEEIAGKEAKAVAYVILPEVIVVSAADFISEKAIKVTIDSNADDLLPELRNSYKYRREQISGGFIEEAAGFAPDKITYQNDAAKEKLIPLNFDGKINPVKQAKKYPEYDFFKSKL